MKSTASRQSYLRYMTERYWLNPHYWIDKVLSEEVDGGGATPPNNNQSLVIRTDVNFASWYKKYAIEFHDDGRSIYIGFWDDDNHEWQGSWDASLFRSFALWYLKRWAINDWFGLRSWLYFKWLSYKVENQPKIKM